MTNTFSGHVKTKLSPQVMHLFHWLPKTSSLSHKKQRQRKLNDVICLSVCPSPLLLNNIAASTRCMQHFFTLRWSGFVCVHACYSHSYTDPLMRHSKWILQIIISYYINKSNSALTFAQTWSISDCSNDHQSLISSISTPY